MRVKLAALPQEMVAGSGEAEEDGWSGDDGGEVLGGGFRIVDGLRIGWSFGWFGIGWVGWFFGSWVNWCGIIWDNWIRILLPDGVERDGLVGRGEVVNLLAIAVTNAGAVWYGVPVFETVTVFGEAVCRESGGLIEVIGLIGHIAGASVGVEVDGIAWRGSGIGLPLSVESDGVVINCGDALKGLCVRVTNAGAVWHSIPILETVTVFGESVFGKGFLFGVGKALVWHVAGASVGVEFYSIAIFIPRSINGSISSNIVEGFIPTLKLVTSARRISRSSSRPTFGNRLSL